MADQETYDSVINWNRALLATIGLWPNENNEYSMFSTIRFFTVVSIIFYGGVGSWIANLFSVCRDMDSVMGNLTDSSFAMTNSLVKTLVWWRSKTDLGPIYNCIRADWQKSKTATEYNEMTTVAKLSRSMIKLFVVMAQGNVFIRCSFDAFPAKLSHSPRSRWPCNASTTLIFEITCFSRLVGGFAAATTYVAIDGFIGFSVLHVCGQMAILRNELRCLADPIVKEEANSLDSIRKKLRFITRRHAYLISLVEIIENDFNVTLLLQVVALSAQICFQGYQTSKALSSQEAASFAQLFFVCYFALCVALLFCIYCYVDEQLAIQTSGLRIAAYDCEWHRLPTNEVRSLAFIVLRTERPPCLTAGQFFAFTLANFGEVLKTSVGYLSFLITIREF